MSSQRSRVGVGRAARPPVAACNYRRRRAAAPRRRVGDATQLSKPQNYKTIYGLIG